MATFKSTQITNIETVPITKLQSNVNKGVVLAATWDYTAPGSGEPAAGDTLRLSQIQKAARVLQTFFTWSAQDATATMAIGITGTTARYMAAQTMTSAGVKFAPTIIAEANLETTGNVNGNADEEQIGTLATAGMAASGTMAGWFLYMV